jgi:ferredoxin-NADP reductase
MSRESKATVTKIESIAKDTVEVTLVAAEKFKFTPGQYVTITNPNLSHLGVLEQFRDMSIASDNRQQDSFKIAFRLSDSPFKIAISNTVGLILNIGKPSGIFSESITANSVAIAGGIGVTPFISLVRSGSKFTLACFNNDAKHAPYLSELRKSLGSKLINQHQRPSLKNLRYIVENNKNADYYIAGPPSMIETTRTLLISLMVSDKMIHTESFSGYDIPEHTENT